MRAYSTSAHLVCAVVACLGGCTLAEKNLEELDVLYDGCELVREGCRLQPEGVLTFWVARPRIAAADTFLRVEHAGRILDEGEAMPDGLGVRLTIPLSQPGLLRLLPNEPDYRPWELDILEASSEPELTKHARELRFNGKLRAAQTRLQEGIATLSVEDRSAALSLLGRIQRALGEPDAAWNTLEKARRAHQEVGATAAYINDTTLLVYIASETNERLSQAAETLVGLDTTPVHHASSAYLIAYYRGFMARLLGDLAKASHWFAKSAEIARRMDWQSRYNMASEFLARVAQSLGHHAKAVDTLSQLVTRSAGSDPCHRATLLNNYAWAILLGESSDSRVSGPERPAQDTARAALTDALGELVQCGEHPAVEAEIRANVAFHALLSGDVAAAEAELTAVQELPLSIDTSRWLEDIRGRIALAADRPQDAVEHYRALEGQASSRDQRWRAAVGIARAYSAAGDAEASHRAFARAFVVEREEGLSIPFELGRGQFLAQREVVAREFVESLLRHGHSDQALELTRTRRALSLEGLIATQRIEGLNDRQRVAWSEALSRYRAQRDVLDREITSLRTAPRSEREQRRSRIESQRQRVGLALRAVLDLSRVFTRAQAKPTQSSESLRLSFFDLGERWVGWANTPQRPEARLVEKPRDPEKWPQAMLQAFDHEIENASAVRIVGGPEIDEISFAATRWRGAPLGVSRPVLRAIDLPSRGALEPRGTALLVVDPRRDLPMARLEGVVVARRLQELGFSVRTLEGRGATRSRVASELETAELFHYAGHGLAKAAEEWSAGLPLADGVLSVADVLAARDVPRVVVLSACDGARGNGVSVASGIAQSFLVSGSEFVLASIDPVPDRTATQVSRSFWSSLESTDEVPAAWMRTVRTLRARGTDDWTSFRLLSR